MGIKLSEYQLEQGGWVQATMKSASTSLHFLTAYPPKMSQLDHPDKVQLEF